MVIVLIILLTIINVAINISMTGLELSYQVGMRVHDIRRKSGEVILRKHKVLNKINGDVNSLIESSTKIVKRGTKTVLRLLKVVVVSLRSLLCSVLGIVLFLDAIIFMLLVAVTGAYLLLFNQQ